MSKTDERIKKVARRAVMRLDRTMPPPVEKTNADKAMAPMEKSFEFRPQVKIGIKSKNNKLFNIEPKVEKPKPISTATATKISPAINKAMSDTSYAKEKEVMKNIRLNKGRLKL